MRSHILSLESVAFQSTAFYDDLTQAFETLRQEPPSANTKRYYELPATQAVLHTITAHTGLCVMFYEPHLDGPPAMLSPTYTLSHIFLDDTERVHFAQTAEVAKILALMRQPAYSGTIDLKNAKVTGDFAKLPNLLRMPHELLSAGTYLGQVFTSREVAALLLHEVGHAFTALEYLNRMVTTNQVLAGVSQALLSNQPETFEVVVSMAQLRLELDPKQTAALKAVKSAEAAGAVLATAAVDKSYSELGDSVFDQTACEQLADQFAARCGAGRELVLALARVEQRNPKASYWWRLTRDAFSFSLGAIITVPVFVLVALTSNGKGRDTYGSFHTRISRLRGEFIEHLKDRDLSPPEKQQYVDALKEVDELLATESNKLNFFHGLLNLVNSAWRSDHNYELLQRQLESYTQNGFFGHAAKFSTL